jgi:hypothetical protein
MKFITELKIICAHGLREPAHGNKSNSEGQISKRIASLRDCSEIGKKRDTGED